MTKARRMQMWVSVHRYLGLATFGLLAIAAITGCFLCFDKAIDAALNPDLFHAAADTARTPAVTLVDRLAMARPDLVVRHFPLNPPPGRTIEVGVGPAQPLVRLGYDEMFLDPGDGRIVGMRSSGPGWDRRHIVAGVFQFHSTLLAGRWGRWLMGLAAFGWLIGNAVGVYLTFPRSGPFMRQWKRRWTIDRGARLRRFMLELHQSSGLWLLPGAMVLAFSSVAMNFYDEAFVPVIAALSPPLGSPFDRAPSESAPAADGELRPTGFARALAVARDRASHGRLRWQPAAMSYVADRRLYGVSFTDDGRENYRLLGPTTYYIDATRGRVVYIDDPYRDSAGRKLGRALYPLHSGEVIGAVGIGIVFVLGIATAEMCVTGVYTWWKKRRSRLAMRKPGKAPAERM